MSTNLLGTFPSSAIAGRQMANAHYRPPLIIERREYYEPPPQSQDFPPRIEPDRQNTRVRDRSHSRQGKGYSSESDDARSDKGYRLVETVDQSRRRVQHGGDRRSRSTVGVDGGTGSPSQKNTKANR